MQRAIGEARATGRLGTGIRNRDAFLNQLEGMYVDDDPGPGHHRRARRSRIPTCGSSSGAARAI